MTKKKIVGTGTVVAVLRMRVEAVERHPEGWVLTCRNEEVGQGAVRIWTRGWEGPAPVVEEALVVELSRESTKSTKVHERGEGMESTKGTKEHEERKEEVLDDV